MLTGTKPTFQTRHYMVRAAVFVFFAPQRYVDPISCNKHEEKFNLSCVLGLPTPCFNHTTNFRPKFFRPKIFRPKNFRPKKFSAENFSAEKIFGRKKFRPNFFRPSIRPSIRPSSVRRPSVVRPSVVRPSVAVGIRKLLGIASKVGNVAQELQKVTSLQELDL